MKNKSPQLAKTAGKACFWLKDFYLTFLVLTLLAGNIASGQTSDPALIKEFRKSANGISKFSFKDLRPKAACSLESVFEIKENKLTGTLFVNGTSFPINIKSKKELKTAPISYEYGIEINSISGVLSFGDTPDGSIILYIEMASSLSILNGCDSNDGKQISLNPVPGKKMAEFNGAASGSGAASSGDAELNKIYESIKAQYDKIVAKERANISIRQKTLAGQNVCPNCPLSIAKKVQSAMEKEDNTTYIANTYADMVSAYSAYVKAYGKCKINDKAQVIYASEEFAVVKDLLILKNVIRPDEFLPVFLQKGANKKWKVFRIGQHQLQGTDNFMKLAFHVSKEGNNWKLNYCVNGMKGCDSPNFYDRVAVQDVQSLKAISAKLSLLREYQFFYSDVR
jgi:hypothetical protein